MLLALAVVVVDLLESVQENISHRKLFDDTALRGANIVFSLNKRVRLHYKAKPSKATTTFMFSWVWKKLKQFMSFNFFQTRLNINVVVALLAFAF